MAGVLRRVCCFAFLLMLAMGCVQSASAAQEYTIEEDRLRAAYESGALIRLHILAEDDSPDAQRIKLEVRDAVLLAFEAELSGDDADTLYERLQGNVEIIRLVAEQKARELGFKGSVTAEVGALELPEKAYGSVVLPQGEYRALRITLGKGEGRNWWCVLYPSLCLAVANDEPWKTPAQEEQAEAAASPTVVWDSKKIMEQWLLWPGKE